MTLARQIRNARASLGLTQESLAATCGVTRSAIALFETGRSRPSAAVLHALCQTLGLDPAEALAAAAAPRGMETVSGPDEGPAVLTNDELVEEGA